MNISLLAHAGEHHESSASSLLHLITDDPTLSVPALILGIGIATFGIWLIYKKSLPAGLIVTQLILLVVGMGFYTLAPMLSTVAIVTGFSLSLFLVLNGLRSQN